MLSESTIRVCYYEILAQNETTHVPAISGSGESQIVGMASESRQSAYFRTTPDLIAMPKLLHRSSKEIANIGSSPSIVSI